MLLCNLTLLNNIALRPPDNYRELGHITSQHFLYLYLVGRALNSILKEASDQVIRNGYFFLMLSDVINEGVSRHLKSQGFTLL